jgi:hypothetical protein
MSLDFRLPQTRSLILTYFIILSVSSFNAMNLSSWHRVVKQTKNLSSYCWLTVIVVDSILYSANMRTLCKWTSFTCNVIREVCKITKNAFLNCFWMALGQDGDNCLSSSRITTSGSRDTEPTRVKEVVCFLAISLDEMFRSRKYSQIFCSL